MAHAGENIKLVLAKPLYPCEGLDRAKDLFLVTAGLRLVPYDRDYLDRSWEWLSDPQTRALTLTPAFRREDQQAFFERLSGRTDYLIWGVEHDGRPVGAAGLKQVAAPKAEYWGYLGDKSLWGRKLGPILLALVEEQARERGLTDLFLRVARDNERAIRLYHRTGWADAGEDGEVLHMTKTLAP